MQDDLTLARPTIRRGGASPPIWEPAASIIPIVFPLLVAAIAVGIWLSLTQLIDVSLADRLITWLVIVSPLALWLLAVWVLARAGVYAHPLAVPMGVLLPPVIGLVLLARLPLLPRVLAVTPPAWLIGLMLVRVVGGVFLIAAASGEVRSPWFNLSAGIVDILVGVTALPLAWWVVSGSPTAIPFAIGWNGLGLFDFALAMVLARFGSGPRDMLLLKTPVVSALKPTISGIVTFAVPLAIMIHTLSLWQLITR